MDPGIYFSPDTREIVRVAGGPECSGEHWLQISSDITIGLLAARRILLRRGLVDDPAVVYWYLPQPEVAPTALAWEPTNAGESRGKLRRLRRLFPGARSQPLASL